MAGRQDRKMEVYVTAGELTPPLQIYLLEETKWTKKGSWHIAGGGTAREVKMCSQITGSDRDMVENGRPFGKEECRCDPSVIPGEYCAIPGLAFSLGISERCSVDAHAQGIPFVWCTLILGTLCCRYPLSWLKCASVSLFQWLCFIPTFPLSLLASAAPLSMQHFKIFVFAKYQPTGKQLICSIHASSSGKEHLHQYFCHSQ